MATIKDVARMAGVSQGTVSNILNGSSSVSLDKIKRVEEAMKNLGYIPSKAARNLKNTTTKHVDVILPNINDFAMTQLFSAISTCMRENGYSVSLYITNEVAVIEKECLENSMMSHADGIILMTCQPEKSEYFKGIIENGARIIFVQRCVKNLDADYLCFNTEAIMEEFITQHKESQNLILFTCSRTFTFDANCAAQFEKQGIRNGVNPAIVTVNYNKESAMKEAVLLLEGETRQTVVLCTNALIAIGVHKALEVLNLPRGNVSVYTFDSMTWAQMEKPTVKKIGLPYMELGEKACLMLLEKIGNPIFSECQKNEIYLEKTALDIVERAVPQVLKQKKKLRILMLENGNVVPSYALFSEFEMDTGISVEIVKKPYQELYEAINQSYRTSQYDIYEVDLPWIPYLAANGMIEKIETIEPEYERYLSDVLEEIIPAYTKYHGITYAFPYMYCSQLLFYRKDLFEDIRYKRMFYDMYKTELQPPKTWSEYNAVARFFTRRFNPESKTEYGTTAGGCSDNGAFCEFLPRFFSFGGKLMDKVGNPSFDYGIALKAMKNYKDSFQFAPEGAESFWWDEQCKTFCDGDAAMMVLYNAHAADCINRKKSKIVGKVGFDTIPGRFSVLGGWSLAVDSKSTMKKEAMEFLKWTCTERFSVINTILGGCSPCKRIYNDTEIASVYPWHRKMVDVFEFAQNRAIIPKSGKMIEYRTMEKKMGNILNEILSDRCGMEQGLKEIKEYLEVF